MSLDGRFPHYPGRAGGFLYGRGESVLVVWADDQGVEIPDGSSATEEDLDTFRNLLEHIRVRFAPATWAGVHDAILEAGWEDRGTLRYDIRSSDLLTDAAALAELAQELEHRREAVLSEHGGRHPGVDTAAWPEWVRATATRNAAVRGARALAIAAVEALLNELLAVQHPDQYHEWEVRRRKGFEPKLKLLLELHGRDADDTAWFGGLHEHATLRHTLIHHRPGWVVDQRDAHSVMPRGDMTHESLMETLVVVHQAVVGLFGLYGARPPDTHRPDFLRRTAGW